MIQLEWILAVLYLIGGLNDAFLDLVFYCEPLRRRLAQGRANPTCDEQELNNTPEKRIAIMVPAWDESAVIGAMLESTCDRLEYSNYDIFVGTYPNDEATQMEVARAAFDRPNIHRVVCPNEGPTSKADCLNWIVETIKLRERASGERYEILCLQDAEDVVHPLTLKVFNRFVPEYDLIQLPVIPYERGLHKITGGTYLDEFAEVHLKGLTSRLAVGGMVPSAGVGTAFSRAACDELAAQTSNVLFPTVSLTEDYDFSFRLFRNQRKSGIAEVWVKREDSAGRTLDELVAIREFFPARFGDAVRQKQRWMLGITFQGAQKLGWGRGWRERYMLLRDRIGVPTSLLNLCALFIFFQLYFNIGLHLLHHRTWAQSLPPFYPNHWLALLIDLNLLLLLNRIFQRAYFVGQVASRRQMLLAPLRLLWSNVIDFYCTVHAIRRFTHSRISGKPLKWLKTAHEFPNVEALLQRHRPLGDLLLEHRFISPLQLRKALGIQSRAAQPETPLGQVLLSMNAITPDQLLHVLAIQRESRVMLQQAQLQQVTPVTPAQHLAEADLTPDLPAELIFGAAPVQSAPLQAAPLQPTPLQAATAPATPFAQPEFRPSPRILQDQTDPALPLLLHPRRPSLVPAREQPVATPVPASTPQPRPVPVVMPTPAATNVGSSSPQHQSISARRRAAQDPDLQAPRTAITRIVPAAASRKRYAMLHSVASQWTPPATRPRFVVAVGTRPEAVKLAPVIAELRARAAVIHDPDPVFVCATGQHTQAVREVLGLYGITPDRDLALMTPGQSLAALCARVLSGFEAVLDQLRPEWVIVQGDTATTAMAGLAAFYAGIKVAHVEAGLRTHDLENPFPEEFNRRMVGIFATMHFAATSGAKHNLLREGVPSSRICVTGNTAIDALMFNARRLRLPVGANTAGLDPAGLDPAGTDLATPSTDPSQAPAAGRPLRVLVTAHRRENHEQGIGNICLAIKELVSRHPGRYQFVWPQHPNPVLGESIRRHLAQTPGVTLIPPATYDRLLTLLHRCDFVLTDSGGIQEEAPSFGKPVLILREATERPEGVEAGIAWLVGSEPNRIMAAVERLTRRLDAGAEFPRQNPYGDGCAARRIADHLHGLPVSQFGEPNAPLEAAYVPPALHEASA